MFLYVDASNSIKEYIQSCSIKRRKKAILKKQVYFIRSSLHFQGGKKDIIRMYREEE